MSPKVHSLTGRITPESMRDAFNKVKRNRGAAGIDKVSIQMFAANLEQNLDALMRDLKTGVFQPRPLRRVFIDKGNGKLRPLGIPAVRDRVAQEVVRRLLEPLFEPHFHRASFGL
jgi:retron-type reverse transcriptase